jgi:hypothetical protein
LKYVVDPAGSRVDYAYDLMGRQLGVTGSGAHSAPVYASNLRYRAWGALKDIDYGNGAHGFVAYNGRLQPTSMELRNVNAGSWNQTPLTMTWNYDYYADGRLNHAYDVNNDRFDRKLDYDHAGRLKEAYSGREARGLPPAEAPDNPFRQTFGYDVWGNMTSRSARFWKQTQTPYNTAYVNDRGQDSDYDPAGNVVETTSHVNTFDAAGKQTHSRSQTASDCLTGWAHEIAQGYDGDGRLATRTQTKRIDNYDHNYDPPQLTCQTEVDVTYYVSSAALGGAMLVELNATGDKVKGYVYGGGGRLAKQEVYPSINSSAVTWYHQNPGTPSWVETSAARTFARQEMDPLGAEVGTHDPYLYTPNPTYSDVHGDAPMYVEGGDPLDLGGGCEIDYMPALCSEVQQRMENGSASSEHLTNGRGGWEHVNTPITSLGLGLVSISMRVLSQDNEGPGLRLRWQSFLFNFAPQNQRPLPEHRVLTPEQEQRLQLEQAFVDAGTVLATDEDCAKLFGLNKNTIRTFIRRTLNSLLSNSVIADIPYGMASTRGTGASAVISLDPIFFIDGVHRVSKSSPTDPRQGRAHTILHEIAHALSRIPNDAHDPAGLAVQNDLLIKEKCEKGLAKLASSPLRPGTPVH